MATPEIQTSRLKLRPFTRDDAADVFAYAANPNVSRYVNWPTHHTIADAEAFIEMVLHRPATQHTWAICQLHDSCVIGAIEFGLRSPKEADFHYTLAEPFWGRGLTTEAARAVLAWGIEQYPQIRRIATNSVSQNIASRRVMEKCGLKFERAVMEKWPKCDKPIELSVYGMSRDAIEG